MLPHSIFPIQGKIITSSKVVIPLVCSRKCHFRKFSNVKGKEEVLSSIIIRKVQGKATKNTKTIEILFSPEIL